MVPPEPRYPATANPGYMNTVEAQQSDLKYNLMKSRKALKEEINKLLKEIQANTIKQKRK